MLKKKNKNMIEKNKNMIVYNENEIILNKDIKSLVVYNLKEIYIFYQMVPQYIYSFEGVKKFTLFEGFDLCFISQENPEFPYLQFKYKLFTYKNEFFEKEENAYDKALYNASLPLVSISHMGKEKNFKIKNQLKMKKQKKKFVEYNLNLYFKITYLVLNLGILLMMDMLTNNKPGGLSHFQVIRKKGKITNPVLLGVPDLSETNIFFLTFMNKIDLTNYIFDYKEEKEGLILYNETEAVKPRRFLNTTCSCTGVVRDESLKSTLCNYFKEANVNDYYLQMFILDFDKHLDFEYYYYIIPLNKNENLMEYKSYIEILECILKPEKTYIDKFFIKKDYFFYK